MVNNNRANSVLNLVVSPLNLDLSFIYDNKYKILFLFGFGFTIVFIRSLTLIKNLNLLPFKLGVFSFIYSILGFDVT
jgi:hypothetical protein